jgi:hypothetical protein
LPQHIPAGQPGAIAILAVHKINYKRFDGEVNRESKKNIGIQSSLRGLPSGWGIQC